MKNAIKPIVVSIFFSLSFFASTQNSGDNPKWIAPNGSGNLALKNQTMEIGFYLKESVQQATLDFIKNPSQGLNPYDPEHINFSAVFISPSGKIHKQNGFFYQDFSEDLKNNQFVQKTTKYPWRLRFSPDELGDWKMNATVWVKGQQETSAFNLSFNCQNSDHKGPLTVSHTGTDADRYLGYAQTGESFKAMGINLSNWGPFGYKPEDNRNHINAVQTHADQKGNFTRFEMGAQNGLPDWQDMRNYTEKQDEMFAFDRLFQKAESNKMYYIIFRHHVEITGPDWGVSNWKNNPYNKALGLTKLSDYYKNPEAIKWQKNNLRYMYSRWGYSPYWSFYGYSELEKFYEGMIEQEGISEKKAIAILLEWFLDQKKFIREELKTNELFSNSYGRLTDLESRSNFDGFFHHSDVVALHIYSTVKRSNFERRYDDVVEFWDQYRKPIILEEMGINDDKLPIMCCTKIEFHNSIWATAFMGDIGTGLDWWYDRGIFDFNYNKDFKNIADFFENEDLKKEKYIPQKWSDAKDSKRKIESYQLVNESKNKILGWLHNASYYWRNEAHTNPCLQSLLDSSNLAEPCVVADGYVMGKKETPKDYARDIHEDRFTSLGGFQPILSTNGIDNNPTFKVENVNFSRGNNKYWYKVEFYSTQPDHSMEIIQGATQFIKANFFKDLIIHVPNLDDSNPDVCFKITLIGKGKTAEETALQVK